MSSVDLMQQATVVRDILPTADVRTDQCDILRVYHRHLMGCVMPLPSGGSRWSVIDLAAEGDVVGVSASPIIEAEALSQVDAARAMAVELRQLGGA